MVSYNFIDIRCTALHVFLLLCLSLSLSLSLFHPTPPSPSYCLFVRSVFCWLHIFWMRFFCIFSFSVRLFYKCRQWVQAKSMEINTKKKLYSPCLESKSDSCVRSTFPTESKDTLLWDFILEHLYYLSFTTSKCVELKNISLFVWQIDTIKPIVHINVNNVVSTLCITRRPQILRQLCSLQSFCFWRLSDAMGRMQINVYFGAPNHLFTNKKDMLFDFLHVPKRDFSLGLCWRIVNMHCIDWINWSEDGKYQGNVRLCGAFRTNFDLGFWRGWHWINIQNE